MPTSTELTREGLNVVNLSTLHQRAARSCIDLCIGRVAVNYAEKNYEMEMYRLGPDYQLVAETIRCVSDLKLSLAEENTSGESLKKFNSVRRHVSEVWERRQSFS